MDIWPKDRGTYYGSFAFASIILACYGGVLTSGNIHGWTWLTVAPEWLTLVAIGLGMVYTVAGILGSASLEQRSPPAVWGYFLFQAVVLTAILVISPSRGFIGMLCLPVVSQAVFMLRWVGVMAICLYFYTVNVAIWGIPYGWNAAFNALISYSAGFVFTVAFTYITRQALEARRYSETLRQELETANAQLRAHAAQAGELATTRERNRVAREIHDGVGHYLTVVKTQLDAATALLPAQPDRARDAVGKAARLAAEALDDVRRSVGALRTDAPRPPLPEALRELAHDGDPAPTLAIEGDSRPLAPAIEHALYRAAQEGLTNIRKHARASQALLRLDFRTPQRVVLELADNGVGVETSATSAGFGLRGLRERIQLLGGTVATGNRLEGGFILRVEVPA